eukprot:551282-Pelagomonas_calceolata.AAC.1
MGKNKRKLQEGAEQARQDAPKEERDAKHEMDMKKKHREGVGEGQQTEGKKKKKDSEIDDIFGSGPAKKGAAHGTSNSGTHKEEDTSKTGGEKGKEASKDAKQARKRTEEGYAIYTEDLHKKKVVDVWLMGVLSLPEQAVQFYKHSHSHIY